MFKKLITFAVVATVAIANDFLNEEVQGDFPMPVVPWNFETTSYTYIYSNGRLAPAN